MHIVTVCNSSCGQRSCMQNDSNTCCDILCVGGCTGPKASDCVACSGVVHGKTCMKTCPAQAMGVLFLEFNERRCITMAECIRNIDLDSKTKEPYKAFFRDSSNKTGKCLKKCPADFEPDRSDPSVCKRCKGGKCPVTCSGGPIRNVQQAQQFRGCTKVETAIEINILRSSSGAG